MKKYLAEVIGTAALVLIGCGAVVVGGFGTAGRSASCRWRWPSA